MGNLPLHPMVVHFPLALAILLPLLLGALLWREWRGRLRARTWWIATLVAGLLTVGAFVSLKSGDNEEERVESAVPETALNLHEERAEAFLWVTLIPLALVTVTALSVRSRTRRWIGTGAVLGGLLVAALAVRVGHSGGLLVYEHNAAAAYGADAPTRTGDLSHEDDDD